MSLRPSLIMRARRLAAAAETSALTDTVVISHAGADIYRGAARFIMAGKTQAINSEIGATFLYQYAELHIPNGSAQLTAGDTLTVINSLEPALVNRRGRIESAEPVTSIAGFQRINIRLDGTLG